MSETDGYEIENFPTIRTQDGVGVCYGFSATQLLNFQYCKQNELDCARPENQLSALHISSYYTPYVRQINEGGQTAVVLSNLYSRNPKILKEDCAPFEKLAHSGSSNKGMEQLAGINFLKEIYEEKKANPQVDISCHAKRISEVLPLSKNLLEITIAIKEAVSFENLIYNIAVKGECRQDSTRVELPQYTLDVYPKAGSNPAPSEVTQKIENLILNNIPVSLSFCAGNYFDPNLLNETCEGHAITITGVKEVCHMDYCETLFKVHNSYGQGWQDSYNDGWLKAQPLIQRAQAYSDFNYLTYISQYQDYASIPKKALAKKQSNKQPQDFPKKEMKIAIPKHQSSTNNGIPAHIDIKRRPVFTCDDGYFGEKWISDKNCKLLHYQN